MKKLFLIVFVVIFTFSMIPTIIVRAESEETTTSPFLNSPDPESTYAAAMKELETATSSIKIQGFTALGLPAVMILPDSPFYPVKLFWEQILLVFTFGVERKTTLLLDKAEERLAESYMMVEKKEFEKAEQALNEYADLIDQIKVLLVQINSDQVLQIVRKVEANTVKQQEVLAYFTEKTGESGVFSTTINEMSLKAIKQAIDILVEKEIATPSFELKNKIQAILQSDAYTEDIKNDLQTRMNEKLRKEIQKQNILGE